MRWFAFLAAFSAIATPSWSETDARIISDSPAEIAVTVYRDDLALITERRIVEIPAGRSTIAFEGVNDRMIPQSALLREFGAIAIERNFDFDLLSPAALFNNAIGERVLVTRTARATGVARRVEAEVVSASPTGGVVLKIDNDFEAYQCSGAPERVSFAPDLRTLKSQPTLSIDVRAETAGEQELTISYLTSGFDWQADYVLSLSETAGKAAITGWMTLTNGTAVSINNAPTAVVAGNLQRLDETYSEEIHAPFFFAHCWPSDTTTSPSRNRGVPTEPDEFERAVAPQPALRMEAMMDQSIVVTAQKLAEREDLGDYKLYRTPRRTTVAAHQTKQVLFLDKKNVDVSNVYLFDVTSPYGFDEDPTPAIIEYRIDNSAAGALAQPLPKGAVRVMTRTQTGAPFYLGEDEIEDLAVGLPVKIAAAASNDVQMATTVLSQTTNDRETRVDHSWTVEHRFSNGSSQPKTIEFAIGKGDRTSYRIDRSNKRRLQNEASPTWRFRMPAESETTLRYRIRWSE